ncbi:MAG: ATP-binding protein [Pseudonocardia sp.]|nr:ATP-binding protein [Pseudonocardia sp.]
MTDNHTASAGGRRLRLCHRAEPGQLRQIRRRVETWARARGMPADALVDLQLALGEAVANGVEHAYPDDRSGTVEVDLDVHRVDMHGGGRVVTARVADHGTWRPAAEHPGHRGRGLLMIDRLARRVSVERRPWGTEVRFEIPFAAQPVG